MSTPVVNIEIIQGATFSMKFVFKDQATNQLLDASLWTFCGGVSQSEYDLETFDFTFDTSEVNLGVVYAILPDTVTTQLDFLSGVYSVFFTLDDGTRTKYIKGSVSVELGGNVC